jgi:hypothetical protein
VTPGFRALAPETPSGVGSGLTGSPYGRLYLDVIVVSARTIDDRGGD